MNKYLSKYISTSPLVIFRILFGILMSISILRFWYNGWIEKLYILPSFHFHYQGFEWIKVPGEFTYYLFATLLICTILISLGLFYKIATSIFFLVFTYVELLDKTTYLNHYYFISIISLILIFLPAHRMFSLDTYFNRVKSVRYIPVYTIDILKVLIAIVYVYAGLAKINTDWLLHASPLNIWLPSKFDFPILGGIMHKPWLHYAFSWAGMLFDTFIVLFLLFKKTRVIAFLFIFIFHIMTGLLFPIGMFPYVMIFSVLIFFSPNFHDKILLKTSSIFPFLEAQLKKNNKLYLSFWAQAQKVFLASFLLLQLLLPWRYLLYDGNIFWNEMGYRFAWRVMLMEKVGYAEFTIKNTLTGSKFRVENSKYLTPFQEKQMSTQVDFMIEYAKYLALQFKIEDQENIEVYVDSYVALNGRKSQIYVLPTVNLLNVSLNSNYNKILAPLNE